MAKITISLFEKFLILFLKIHHYFVLHSFQMEFLRLQELLQMRQVSSVAAGASSGAAGVSSVTVGASSDVAGVSSVTEQEFLRLQMMEFLRFQTEFLQLQQEFLRLQKVNLQVLQFHLWLEHFLLQLLLSLKLLLRLGLLLWTRLLLFQQLMNLQLLFAHALANDEI